MSEVTDRTLAALPDVRKPRGKLYPLPALRNMTVAAILCGCKTFTADAQWRRDSNHRLGHGRRVYVFLKHMAGESELQFGHGDSAVGYPAWGG